MVTFVQSLPPEELRILIGALIGPTLKKHAPADWAYKYFIDLGLGGADIDSDATHLPCCIVIGN